MRAHVYKTVKKKEKKFFFASMGRVITNSAAAAVLTRRRSVFSQIFFGFFFPEPLSIDRSIFRDERGNIDRSRLSSARLWSLHHNKIFESFSRPSHTLSLRA
jgi:hypothetical protein